MGRNTNRLCFLIAACSVAGVVLGGTASRAEINECFVADAPTSSCLTQDSLPKIIEGMSMGLVAGAGAAIGATFHIWQRDN